MSEKFIKRLISISYTDKNIIYDLHYCSRQSFIQNMPKMLVVRKHPSRGVLIKRCCENLQQIYRCDFKKAALQLYLNHTSALVSPVNLLYIFRKTVPKNTSGGLLLVVEYLRTSNSFEAVNNEVLLLKLVAMELLRYQRIGLYVMITKNVYR